MPSRRKPQTSPKGRKPPAAATAAVVAAQSFPPLPSVIQPTRMPGSDEPWRQPIVQLPGGAPPTREGPLALAAATLADAAHVMANVGGSGSKKSAIQPTMIGQGHQLPQQQQLVGGGGSGNMQFQLQHGGGGSGDQSFLAAAELARALQTGAGLPALPSVSELDMLSPRGPQGSMGFTAGLAPQQQQGMPFSNTFPQQQQLQQQYVQIQPPIQVQHIPGMQLPPGGQPMHIQQVSQPFQLPQGLQHLAPIQTTMHGLPPGVTQISGMPPQMHQHPQQQKQQQQQQQQMGQQPIQMAVSQMTGPMQPMQPPPPRPPANQNVLSQMPLPMQQEQLPQIQTQPQQQQGGQAGTSAPPPHRASRSRQDLIDQIHAQLNSVFESIGPNLQQAGTTIGELAKCGSIHDLQWLLQPVTYSNACEFVRRVLGEQVAWETLFQSKVYPDPQQRPPKWPMAPRENVVQVLIQLAIGIIKAGTKFRQEPDKVTWFSWMLEPEYLCMYYALKNNGPNAATYVPWCLQLKPCLDRARRLGLLPPPGSAPMMPPNSL